MLWSVHQKTVLVVRIRNFGFDFISSSTRVDYWRIFFLWRKWFFDEKRFWNEAVLSFLVLGRKCNWGILSQAKTGGRKWAGNSEPGDCRALPSTPLSPLSHFPRADVNLKLIKPMRLQIKGCVICFRYLQLESLNLKFRVCAWRICKRNGTQVDNLDRHWSI